MSSLIDRSLDDIIREKKQQRVVEKKTHERKQVEKKEFRKKDGKHIILDLSESEVQDILLRSNLSFPEYKAKIEVVVN